MIHFTYLIGLLCAVAGLLVIDRRLQLAFWRDARRTFTSIGLGMLVFILWDVAGIAGGVFFHPPTAFSLPFTIAPNFPFEELVFLFLLCYSALLLYLGASRRWPNT